MKYVIMIWLTCFAMHAQDTKNKPHGAVVPEVAETVLQGYVVDAMCAEGMARKPETVMKRAASHSRSCALHEECASSGFGVFMEGKWYKFDEAGNRKAIELLKSSKRAKGLSVVVHGKHHGELFLVTSIAEHEIKGSPGKK